MRLYGLLGGQIRICVQSMGQTRGVRGHAPLGKFCSFNIKAFTNALRVK